MKVKNINTYTKSLDWLLDCPCLPEATKSCLCHYSVVLGIIPIHYFLCFVFLDGITYNAFSLKLQVKASFSLLQGCLIQTVIIVGQKHLKSPYNKENQVKFIFLPVIKNRTKNDKLKLVFGTM